MALMPKAGVPCQEIWDRLNAIYGEDRAVAVALELLRRNERTRKIPLVGPY